MNLIDIREASDAQLSEAARILVEALSHVPSAWKTHEAAMDEVASFFIDDERRALLACEGAFVRGWIGRIAVYSHCWELHPLVVDPPAQGRGVGTALVRALEQEAALAGVLTIMLGSDDDFGGTTLFGRNLGLDPLPSLTQIAPTDRGHPFTFYRRLGYAVCGVIPDANGPGRHDILMSKRIGGDKA